MLSADNAVSSVSAKTAGFAHKRQDADIAAAVIAARIRSDIFIKFPL